MKFIVFVLCFVLLRSATIGDACNTGCSTCNQDTTLCFICNDPNHVAYKDGTCDELPPFTSDPNCWIYDQSQQCVSCKPNYIIGDNGRCVFNQNPTGCVYYDPNGNCLKCSYGTSLYNGNCLGIVNCILMKSGKCQACSTGFKLKNNICVVDFAAQPFCLLPSVTVNSILNPPKVCPPSACTKGATSVQLGCFEDDAYNFADLGKCLYQQLLTTIANQPPNPPPCDLTVIGYTQVRQAGNQIFLVLEGILSDSIIFS